MRLQYRSLDPNRIALYTVRLPDMIKTEKKAGYDSSEVPGGLLRCT